MRIRYGWELALAALLVMEIVAFGAINPRMLDLNMLLFSTSDFICIGIVALPLTMVIVSGGIDISFGSTIGLCAIALGVLFQSGVPMPLAILLTLLLGALCGLINAGLIIYTKVNPLVITLGTLYLFAGSALLLSGMAGAGDIPTPTLFPVLSVSIWVWHMIRKSIMITCQPVRCVCLVRMFVRQR